jgi:multiple sugar transport system substrate-binding protein/raffinose/stachyose/melibiose transport system substrate-binding protein
MKKFTLIMVCLVIAAFAFAGGDQEEPMDASGPSGEINLFAWLPDAPDVVENWVTGFEAKYPGITVNAQMMVGQGLIENLEPRFASNNVPDIFSFELDPFSRTQVKAGHIADVGDTVAWANMVPAMQSSWTYSGVKYGISGGVCTTLYFYNQDYFDKAGITEHPTNWDEFIAMCDKLKAAGITPLVWYAGFPNMLSNGPLSWGFANDIMTIEPDIIDTLATESYDFASNPGWLKMYEKMKQLEDKGFFLDGFTSTDYQGGVDQFNSGDAAMILGGTWQAGLLIDKSDFNTGLMIPPWNDAGNDLIAVNASETGWSVGANGNETLGKLMLDFMFVEAFDVYQNPRGCVSPFKDTKNYQIDPKLEAAMAELNSYTSATDLWFRNTPTGINMEGRVLAQSIHIDKTPAEVIKILTKVQKDYIDSM